MVSSFPLRPYPVMRNIQSGEITVIIVNPNILSLWLQPANMVIISQEGKVVHFIWTKWN